MMDSYDMGPDLFWDDDFMMDGAACQVPFDFDSSNSDEMHTEEQDETVSQ
jgi:hypothetical protein